MNDGLHSPRHRLVELCQVIGSDCSPNLSGDFFQTPDGSRAFLALEMFHLAPQVLNGVDVRRVPRPARKKFDAMFRVPFLC